MTTQINQLTELTSTSDGDLLLIRENATGVDKKMQASNLRAKATTKDDVGLGDVDNVSAASLRDRSTHTGTQTLSTISDSGTMASQNANGVAITGGNITADALTSGTVPSARIDGNYTGIDRTAAVFSHPTDTGSVTTTNLRAVIASETSTATGARSAVIGSLSSTATGSRSAVIGSQSSDATSTRCLVGGSLSSSASGSPSAVLGSNACAASGATSGVLGSASSSASGDSSAVVASTGSTASAIRSAIVASQNSTASDNVSVVIGSRTSTAGAGGSSVLSSDVCTASGVFSTVVASTGSTASGPRSAIIASQSSFASGPNFASTVIGSISGNATGDRSAVLASESATASGAFCMTVASRRTENNTTRSLALGDAGSGAISTANRKIHLFGTTGNVSIAGTLTQSATFTDFAEMMPNGTGAEIEAGTLLTLDDGAVRPADEGEEICGVVSHTAAILAGDTPFCWQGRYLHDEFGRRLYEDILDPDWQAEIPDPDWKAEIADPDWDGEGDQQMIANPEPQPMIPNPEPQPTITVLKENPNWNPELEQVTRSERPDEWTPVGLIGQVFVRLGEQVQAGDRITAKGGKGYKTTDRTGLKVMTVTKDFDGDYGIARCLLNVMV